MARRAFISDTHFGSGDELLHHPLALERLEEHLAWADELVINGDLFELVFAPLTEARWRTFRKARARRRRSSGLPSRLKSATATALGCHRQRRRPAEPAVRAQEPLAAPRCVTACRHSGDEPETSA
ncbi:MAG TPA: hypothetical protein VGI55_11995 [Solirubrobacteraceae bacterium]|jgi:hypothetical protein